MGDADLFCAQALAGTLIDGVDADAVIFRPTKASVTSRQRRNAYTYAYEKGPLEQPQRALRAEKAMNSVYLQ